MPCSFVSGVCREWREGGKGDMERSLGGQDGGRGRMEEGRTPMQKAPPKSLRATQGQGSREWSIVVRRGGDCEGVAGGDGGG